MVISCLDLNKLDSENRVINFFTYSAFKSYDKMNIKIFPFSFELPICINCSGTQINNLILLATCCGY